MGCGDWDAVGGGFRWMYIRVVVTAIKGWPLCFVQEYFVLLKWEDNDNEGDQEERLHLLADGRGWD